MGSQAADLSKLMARPAYRTANGMPPNGAIPFTKIRKIGKDVACKGIPLDWPANGSPPPRQCVRSKHESGGVRKEERKEQTKCTCPAVCTCDNTTVLQPQALVLRQTAALPPIQRQQQIHFHASPQQAIQPRWQQAPAVAPSVTYAAGQPGDRHITITLADPTASAHPDLRLQNFVIPRDIGRGEGAPPGMMFINFFQNDVRPCKTYPQPYTADLPTPFLGLWPIHLPAQLFLGAMGIVPQAGWGLQQIFPHSANVYEPGPVFRWSQGGIPTGRIGGLKGENVWLTTWWSGCEEEETMVYPRRKTYA